MLRLSRLAQTVASNIKNINIRKNKMSIAAAAPGLAKRRVLSIQSAVVQGYVGNKS